MTGADDPDGVASRRRAVAAGVGMLVVVLTYGPNDLDDGARWWAAGAAVVVAVMLADALADVRELLPVPGLAPLTIAAALVAMAACVPETDQFVVAALLPAVVVVLEVVTRRQAAFEWYAVAAASAGWAGMFGATGRQSALVGALFAWWAVLLLPLVHRIRPIATTVRATAVAVIGGAAALVVARTGGIADSGSAAALAALVAAIVSVVLAVAVAGSSAQPSSGTG